MCLVLKVSMTLGITPLTVMFVSFNSSRNALISVIRPGLGDGIGAEMGLWFLCNPEQERRLCVHSSYPT